MTVLIPTTTNHRDGTQSHAAPTFLNGEHRNFKLDPTAGRPRILLKLHQYHPGRLVIRKQIFSVALIALLHIASGSAQTSTDAQSKKAVISGRVSMDAKTIIGDQKTWFVNNPAALAGREGHIVRIKCRLYRATNKILVLSVKPADGQTQYAINYGDAAFRR